MLERVAITAELRLALTGAHLPSSASPIVLVVVLVLDLFAREWYQPVGSTNYGLFRCPKPRRTRVPEAVAAATPVAGRLRGSANLPGGFRLRETRRISAPHYGPGSPSAPGQ